MMIRCHSCFSQCYTCLTVYTCSIVSGFNGSIPICCPLEIPIWCSVQKFHSHLLPDSKVPFKSGARLDSSVHQSSGPAFGRKIETRVTTRKAAAQQPSRAVVKHVPQQILQHMNLLKCLREFSSIWSRWFRFGTQASGIQTLAATLVTAQLYYKNLFWFFICYTEDENT